MSEIDLTPLIDLLYKSLFARPQPEPCDGCGSTEIRAKGKCQACYDRWRRAGRPDEVPPRRRRPRRTGARLEDYAQVRSLGASVAQAAAHAGIPEHAGWRAETPERQAA